MTALPPPEKPPKASDIIIDLPTPNNPHSQKDVDKLVEYARQSAAADTLPFIEPPLVPSHRTTVHEHTIGLPRWLLLAVYMSAVTAVGIAAGRAIVYFHLFGF